ncbi:hypothetical protein TCE0_039r13189 [Talaromyces pinophilus]|uniref:Uncharacterized protein n=1 Tax=Talaromyces pinophilus TaxID=128442 RepID=A0A6N4SLR7_TALPI|nr:hypothetical protein TCE0_039r13189 [Talaromyces pinophilus]
MEAEAGPEIDLEEEVETEEDGVLVEEVERDALVVVIEAQVPEEAFREAFLGALPTDEVAAVLIALRPGNFLLISSHFIPLPRNSIINASSSDDHFDCFLAGGSFPSEPDECRFVPAGVDPDIVVGFAVVVGIIAAAGPGPGGPLGVGAPEANMEVLLDEAAEEDDDGGRFICCCCC